ncbi:hypothetical protein [Bradyrhizobium sp. th.b2]|uniref:hypothetical protein n=1 Tax=Bradyrhizobium sp. th-b2 TaxID=172088 RepID=UPI00041E2525|nr:hypothetical protein [Bradyrhizobium sp. th.b2]
MINPTVGRVVWFTPAHGDIRFDGYAAPFAAHVAYVWGPRCVNLMVILPNGSGVVGETSVTLIQDEDSKPGYGRYAEWMPYQVGQAKKHDAAPAA